MIAAVPTLRMRGSAALRRCISGSEAMLELAMLRENGYALSPDQIAQAELNAWSTLWQPGVANFPNKSTIANPPGEPARGVDRWSIGELRQLADIAVEDLATSLKTVGGARDAGDRRRLRYSLRCVVCGAHCVGTMSRTGTPGVPVAERFLWAEALELDETFDLAFDFDTECTTAAGDPQAGISSTAACATGESRCIP
eukprot:3292667-Amphidinium_carterae.3